MARGALPRGFFVGGSASRLTQILNTGGVFLLGECRQVKDAGGSGGEKWFGGFL
jgi:hypothetical protein